MVPRQHDDAGFTLIEVLIAAVVLVTGMLAVLTFVVEAQSTTFANQARTGATALAREVTESARSVPYEQLVTPTLVDALVGRAGISDDERDVAGWQVQRNGVLYTLSVGVCAVDDPRDGTGAHAPGVFCASGTTGVAPQACQDLLRVDGLAGLPGAGVGAAATVGLGDCGLDVDGDGQVDGLVDVAGTLCVGTCAVGGLDTSPADAKRVIVLVRWSRGGGARYVLQAATVVNPGLAGAPAITSLTPSVASPVTSVGTTAVQLAATTSMPAATLAGYVDGTQQGTASGAVTAWTYTWALGAVSSGTTPNTGEVLDGSYLVGLKAFDANGQFGQSRALTIVLNRRAPYPPSGLRAGRNGAAADLDWQPSSERDVELYRGYRQTATGWTQVCETATDACTDPAPPAVGTLSYVVVALDRDTAGGLREGARSTVATAPLLNRPPGAPTGLALNVAGGARVLTWSAPALGDPDLGDAIDHYVVYRDGTAVADRYDRTADGTALTYTDTQAGGQTHSYRVAAVDTHLAESALVGPVAG